VLSSWTLSQNKLVKPIKEFNQDAVVNYLNFIIEEPVFLRELPATLRNQISEPFSKTFMSPF
jgi:hypothetical protein